MTQEEKAKRYDDALEIARKINSGEGVPAPPDWTVYEVIFPELKESEDEKTRKELLKFLESIWHLGKNAPLEKWDKSDCSKWIAWLEKQDNEPNWCHHKVDLSDCSEEYRKAYYDDWNNCNQQHSQYDADKNDVIKCLINGMRFYYENNKNATWGTVNWYVPVKHIIDVLENIQRDVDDAYLKGVTDAKNELEKQSEQILANSTKTCKNEQNDQTNFTEFEEALADVCRGWIGEEIGWKDYIIRNANALLKICQKMWNEVHAAPFEQNPTWGEEDEKIQNNLIDYFKVDDALQYSEMHVVSWLKSLKDRLKGE